MSGVVCPSCGVAVVPGYVRCPKCHKSLPRTANAAVVGGTSVESTARKSPMIAMIAVALIGGGAIAYLGLKSKSSESPPVAPTRTVEPAEKEPGGEVAQPAPAEVPSGPSAEQTAVGAAAHLERELKKQRLWSTVQIFGSRVEVRSGSCSDPAMASALDAHAPAFKSAGLTKLRCLEQSGEVVTDRDL